MTHDQKKSRKWCTDNLDVGVGIKDENFDSKEKNWEVNHGQYKVL